MMAVVGGRLKVVKQAPKLQPEPLSHLFVASMLRSNNKEQIPVDVHKDKLKDAVRDAEAKCKAKYSGLLDYIKFLNKELGIDLTQDYREQWVASVRGDYQKYNPEELVRLTKSVLGSDLERMRSDMTYLRGRAKSIIEQADRALEETENAPRVA
jgi:hypothetical protein